MSTSTLSAAVCAATILTAVGTVSADVIYDSQGFESPTFSITYLQGQNGFTEILAGSGSRPEVVIGPDPELHRQAVRLQIPDVQGSNAGLHISVPDLVAAGYTQITVSFDIYRQTDQWNSNLWWWWDDAGTPTYGLQWDAAGGTNVTLPFGFESGANATPTIKDQWVNVTQTWDLATHTATSSYNGAPMDTSFPITGITTLTGWAFQLGHDEGDGSGSEVAWIDNFVIWGAVPEPSTMVLIGIGCLAMLRRRRP
jgi:hypothetical protein